MMIKRLLLTVLVAAAGAFSSVAIAACEDDDDEVTARSDEEVQIRITDTALDPARVEVTAGTINFDIDNDGENPHELAVETPDGVVESGSISPDGSGSLTVALDEGQYAMYDPLENYRERGVEGVVVVSASTDTVERTVTEEGTDTVIEEDTDTVTREDTDTVTRERVVPQERTVTRERTVPQQETTTEP